MIKRNIKIDIRPNESFFLWGPRQCGKSTLLKQLFPTAFYIDLLASDHFIKYQSTPSLLREELLALPEKPTRIVIDEIQKVPLLLDEVHLLIEDHGMSFALCGSSARKLKRGHANLLGGRALRYELTGLNANECGNDFELVRMLNAGYLPRHYLNPERSENYLRSYVGDYLKEEIMAEGLVRNLPHFSDFLRFAALSDTEIVNYSTIARDVGVSSPTIKGYFEILKDTLIAYEVPAYTKNIKRRTIESPKFYFDDIGVVNNLSKRKALEPGNPLFGKAFENWVFHELHAYNRYTGLWNDIAYWRLSTGVEVDFILGEPGIAIEAKCSARIQSDHLKGLRELMKEFRNFGRTYLVCMEQRQRITEDGIRILPYQDFIDLLWTGQL